MYEHLADFLGGPPNTYHHALYSSWYQHGWGMVLTGNVQVASSHFTLGRDLYGARLHDGWFASAGPDMQWIVKIQSILVW
jgi:hypothetical protein